MIGAPTSRLGEHRDQLVLRARVLGAFALGGFVLLLVAYWHTQVQRGEHYRSLAENNRLRELPIRAPRGLIYDRSGNLLVENAPSFNLLLDRSRASDLVESIEVASRVLGRSPAELGILLERYRRGTPRFTPVLLGENLSLTEVAQIGVRGLEHPEFEIEAGHVRLYRQAEQVAHVMGYLGEVSTADLTTRGLASGDLVGKKGIEQFYDDVLRGRDGQRVVVVDNRGRLLQEQRKQPAIPGRNLHLTLDLALQQEAERGLAAAGQVGAVVALDPRDGAVRALVSAPSFNPNLFARRLRADDWQALLADPRHPLQNRVLQNAYAPGSVFKAIVAVAALSERVVTPADTVHCSGQTRVHGHPFRCWKRAGHGRVNLHAALRESCDVYFYHLAPKLGVDTIASYARRFGLGRPTGVDLAGEKPGLVPDSAWSLAARRHAWYPGETVSVSIGQGPILTTPLQLATAMAPFANGGRRVRPYLLRDEVVGKVASLAESDLLDVDPTAIEQVRRGLWAVVNERGTATGARIPGIEVAGKTGTVQVIAQKTWTDSATLRWEHRDHAWFASFAPVNDPQLVIVVFVEHGGKGSTVAVPIAKRMYEIHFRDHPSARLDL